MNMTIKEELALLNIDEVKNKDELKKAFHTASKKYHPDQVGGSKEMFQMTYSVYQNLLTILNDGNAKYILDFDKKYAINNGKPSSAICNKINKLVINTEKNLINKNDKNDIINYLNNAFFNKYEALLQEYIFNYLNNFLKYNHNDNIKQNDISAIKDDLLSNYELFDLSIENIDKILQDKLKPFYANHNNKVKIEKSKKELENYFIFKLEALKKHWENSYTDYNVYEKNKNMINFKINGMEKELYDYINENYYKIPTD